MANAAQAHLAEAQTQLNEMLARFDSSARQQPPQYAFKNTAALFPEEGVEGLTMVSICLRNEGGEGWAYPQEAAPPDVDGALRAAGFAEEGENCFSVARSAAEVRSLLSSWGLVLVSMADLEEG
eukprot:m.462093 g.462093  ORF g.462093 m.462093 type:complete len:124 (-) comp22515_c0_seq1:182-553(-)